MLANYIKEGFLIQIILYSLVWLVSEYVGLLLCMIMAFVIGGLLFFAYMVEMVQKTKVTKAYFRWMLVSALAPALVAIAFTLLYQGNFDWLN